MTNITLQKQHRTLWHFIPGLALSAVITGVALWGGSIPAVAGAGFSALTLAILLGMVLGTPSIRTSGKAVTVVCCLPSNIYYVWVSFFMASV